MKQGVFFLFGLLVLLILALFLLMPQYRWEGFTGQSSRERYRDTKLSIDEFDKQLANQFKSMSDNDDLLTMYRCLQFDNSLCDKTNSSTCFINKIMEGFSQKNNVLVKSFEKYTTSFLDVRSEIEAQMIAVKEKVAKGRIYGDVYVMLGVSPYLVDVNGGFIAAQYNIDSYLFLPINIMNPNINQQAALENTKVYITCYMIFTGYSASEQQHPQPVDILSCKIGLKNQVLSTYTSRRELCYIQCPKDAKTFCGCAPRLKSDTSVYKSSCIDSLLSAQTPYEKATGINQNFITLYRVNSQSSVVLRNELMVGS